MLTVLAGYDPAESDTVWNVGHVGRTTRAIPRCRRGARIGVVQHLFGSESINQEVNDVLRSDIDRMKEAGAVIVAINDPVFDADKLVARSAPISTISSRT
jgi:Asp-tRNA(Asn)/Glu-tRNA(Gln) amidotransferase A subunit family amidase